MPSFLAAFWNSPEELSTALRWVTIIGIVSTALFAAAAYFVNDRIGTLQAAKVAQQAVSLDRQDAMIRNQSDELQNQQGKISAQSEKITQQISEIERLRMQSESLQQKALAAERGISDTFDFNGGHRQNMGGGSTVLTVGPEAMVFQTILKLYEAKDWNSLKKTCDEQVLKTPNWLTPYLFSGIADANLGLLDEARVRFEYVISKAGNDPHYSDAARLLAEMKSATQH
jgi:peptidyl-tRNA hydrolase